MTYFSDAEEQLIQRFCIAGTGTIFITGSDDSSNISIGKCIIGAASHIGGIRGHEHSPVIIDGCCVLCWSRAYFSAIDKLRAALEAADTRPRIAT